VTTLSLQQGQPAVDGPGNMAERSRQSDYQYNAVRLSDSQSALRALAEGTGGFLVANSNDLRKPFQQIGGDVETHYEALYRPSSSKYDGQFRKIEVKLAHADWRAENRQGYFAIPEMGWSGTLRPFEIAGLMTLNAQPRPHAFKFRSAGFQFRPGVNSQSEIVFELPGAALTATPQPAQKKHRPRLSVRSARRPVGWGPGRAHRLPAYVQPAGRPLCRRECAAGSRSETRQYEYGGVR
jgi:hypothetical protein